MRGLLDETGFGSIKLIQDEEAFRYGTDAVLLGDMASKDIRDGAWDRIMDLGTGTGIVPLIISHKTEATEIYGLEVQESQWELAKENVKLNGLEPRVKMLLGNVKDGAELPELNGLIGTFQAVTCNPPYTEAGRGMVNLESPKAIARHEILGTLEDFVLCAKVLLQEGGALYMVHRPQRMTDVICTMRNHGLEPKVLQLVNGKPGEEPNIMLVKAVKGAGKELKILPEFTVRNMDGSFSKEMLEIYEK